MKKGVNIIFANIVLFAVLLSVFTSCGTKYLPESEKESADTIFYTVNFLDDDGQVIKTERVSYGGAAKAPNAPRKEGYCFIGWDKDFKFVREDTNVTAQFETIENYYGTFEDVFEVRAERDEEKVTVTFSLVQNDEKPVPVVGFQTRLRYDKGFKATDVINGQGVSSAIHENKQYISVVYINLNAEVINENFDFITVTFELTDDIESGDRIYFDTQYVLDAFGNDITAVITISSEFVYDE